MEIIKEYFEKQKKECIRKMEENKILIIHGNAESGKSYMLRSIYNVSKCENKIFQGGVDLEKRIEVLDEILYIVKKNNTWELFLDEFDDYISLEFIVRNLISSKIKITITTKKNQDFFAEYINQTKHFFLNINEIKNKLIQKVEYKPALKKEIKELEMGDWITIDNMGIYNINENTFNELNNIKKERIKRKNDFCHCLRIIEMKAQRIVSIYDFYL